jgi:hypothetical protein
MAAAVWWSRVVLLSIGAGSCVGMIVVARQWAVRCSDLQRSIIGGGDDCSVQYSRNGPLIYHDD